MFEQETESGGRLAVRYPMPVIHDEGDSVVVVVYLVNQRCQNVAGRIVAMLFEHLSNDAARAGRIIRIDSSRCAKNHTALLSSSSTVSQATATPSRMRSSRHWAARVLLP